MSEMIKVDLPVKEIRAYCETQPIKRLSEFAPVYEDLSRPYTDIGLLVEYVPGAKITLLSIARHEIELSEIIGASVSLMTAKGLLQEPFRVPFERGEVIYEKGA